MGHNQPHRLPTMRSSVLLAAAGVAGANAMILDHAVSEFLEWKAEHSKEYPSQSHTMERFNIYQANKKYIEEHNANSEHGFTLGRNQFMDMTHEEYKKFLLGSGVAPMAHKDNKMHVPCHADINTVDSIDWRTQGYVGPVKNQQQCGSCWAFSTVASVEGQYFKKTGTLRSFSEQELVDCNYGFFSNHGCQGGLMDNAFKWLQSNDLHSEEAYPYKGSKHTCHVNSIGPSDTTTRVTGFVDVEHGSESALKDAVATVGPVSIAIDASHRSFQFYKSGIYSEPACSSTQLDHGVAIVGFGSDDGQDYWIVRNSWAAVWGDKGYIKMARNKDNACGVATSAS